jgi:hypothetical protein
VCVLLCGRFFGLERFLARTYLAGLLVVCLLMRQERIFYHELEDSVNLFHSNSAAMVDKEVFV